MKKLFCLLLAISWHAQTHAQTPQKLKLWYTKPAQYFEEALVLGNGKQGATVFGGTKTDQIYLNDLTLWSGEPMNPRMNPEAYKHLPAVRAALQKENYPAADSLMLKMQGKFSESYAPLGTLYLDFDHENTSNYLRDLSLDQATAHVSYQTQGHTIQREYFVSHPDKVFVIHLKSSEKGTLAFRVRFDSKLKFAIHSSVNHLHANGTAPVRADPNYIRKKDNPILFRPDQGTRFSTDVLIQSTDGTVTRTDSSLSFSGGTEAVVLVSMATSFNGFDKSPSKEGLNDDLIAQKQLEAASQVPLKVLKARHLADYQKFYQRVSLTLGGTQVPDMPTDERLRRYAKGESDPYLEMLYFQFGRYLLISCSRTPGVPANLQGLWNPHIAPPWSSNYTMNINAEENYWLAENTNLPEMHQSFLGFLENLEKTGRVTAQTFYNMPGWVVHHNSDIWAMTNPVGDFGSGKPSWANWPMGAAWASTHLWEHYLFTQDANFLRAKAYPLMKGAAEFCLAFLIPDARGRLMTSPSTSPENMFLTPTGYVGQTSYGGTADMAMIRELFLDVLAAEKVLKNDPAFAAQVSAALAKLLPYQIGAAGHLQEWYHDWADQDPKHRHQSHLYGLYPGTHVTLEGTPAIAAAARNTLEIKGDETTGWSKGWRINLWARLQDGEHAYKMYRELLKYVEPDGVKVNYKRGGGTYPNLFDAHPPFQIDGNFGGAAAVAEMLVQSTPEAVYLLPAIPKAWASGSVSGLKTRGGYTLTMRWENSKVVSYSLTRPDGGKPKVFVNGGWK
jgi:alpha-L-fucosidase 2